MPLNLGQMSDCGNRIERDFVEFARLWTAVKEDWNDSRRDQFEREHLASLGGSLKRLASEVTEFSDFAQQAIRELRDDISPSS